MTDIPIKIQFVKSLSNLKPSRMIAVKTDGDDSFLLYVTDKTGIPYPLKDNTGGGGGGTIEAIINTDGNLTITGTTTKTINVSSSLLLLINSALQAGDNISELINDANYITLADIPAFVASDYDLEDFTNVGADPYAHLSDLSAGVTNLSYTASPTQGVVTSDTGSYATIPLADNTNAGLLEPSKYTVLENTSGTNTGDQDLQSVLDNGNVADETTISLNSSTDNLVTVIRPSGVVTIDSDTNYRVGINTDTANDVGGIPFVGFNSVLDNSEIFLYPEDISISNKYKLPSKPSGIHTLATLDDIPSSGSFVPYTGATTDVDLGEYQLKAGQLELDQTPTGTFSTGKIRWNDTAGTAEIRLKGDNVTLQLGQELVKRVVNKTATNITLQEVNYQVVRIIGATGQRLSVDLAQANSEVNSASTLGLVTENIANNQEGFVTFSGEINLINTTGSLQGQTWVDGNVLYLSPTVAGGLTNVAPTAPDHTVRIGYVQYAHATQGKIHVDIDGGYSLNNLHNVKITATTAGKILGSTTEGLWENKSVAEVLGYIPQAKLTAGANITIDETNPLAPVISADVTPSSVGIQQNFYLDATASLADNYTLSNSPSAYSETADAISVTTGLSPVFFERFVSQPLGKTSIPDGTWRFNIYASTSSNTGLNVVDYRINKRVIINGTVGTWTGAGATRTFTASSGTPFAGLTTSGNRLTAPLIETPNQTGWVSTVVSDTVVTVQITDTGYVNESGVSLNAIYYWMFGGATGDITGSTANLYTITSSQPEFTGLNLNDRLVIALFATTDQVSTRTMTLYYGGTEHFTYFESPLSVSHNDLTGLQGGTVGEYYHLTAAEKTIVSNTSGTNTGDNATNTQYSGLATSKQDTLVSGTNIKTLDGIPILGAGNLVSKNGFITQSLGDIYNKTTWIDTADFTVSGGASISVASGKIQLGTSTPSTFTSVAKINNKISLLEKWRIKATVKVLSNAVDSYGIGFGIDTVNTWGGAGLLARFTTFPTTNTLIINNSTNNAEAANVSTFSISLNDILYLELNYLGAGLLKVNLTKGTTTITSSYQYTLTGASLPNTGQFIIKTFGGNYELQSLQIDSLENKYADLMVIEY